MKIKKGFTLAEITVVIVIIGVLAAVIVPTMLKSTNEKMYKLGLKKGYTTLANTYAKLRLYGLQPRIENGAYDKSKALKNMYVGFLDHMDVREITYFKPNEDQGKTSLKNSELKVKYISAINSKEKTIGIQTSTQKSMVDLTHSNDSENKTVHTWITTQDGLSYYLVTATNYTCQTKRTIEKQTTLAKMISNSCVTVFIDSNGLLKGPNKFEPQQMKSLKNKKLDTLSGDFYYVFVGSDGITAGNEEFFATARIIGDLK